MEEKKTLSKNTWTELRLDDNRGPWKAGKLHSNLPLSLVSNALNFPSNVLTITSELKKKRQQNQFRDEKEGQ